MVKEGYWYGLPLVLIGGGLMGLRIYVLGFVFLALAVFILNFFRDPDRLIPDDPRAIVSPADGRVVQIRDETFNGKAFRRVSIFMSPVDVHVNRSPLAGVVGDVVYQKGTFMIASKDEASVRNEQNAFTVAGGQGEVVVKQIAGAVARRIVFWKRRGDAVERGERVGMIKFSSRVDLLVEPEVEVMVKVGDRVQAGSSVMALSPLVLDTSAGREGGADGIRRPEL